MKPGGGQIDATTIRMVRGTTRGMAWLGEWEWKWPILDSLAGNELSMTLSAPMHRIDIGAGIKSDSLWAMMMATNRFNVNAPRHGHIVVQVRIGRRGAAAGAGHWNGALFLQHFELVELRINWSWSWLLGLAHDICIIFCMEQSRYPKYI